MFMKQCHVFSFIHGLLRNILRLPSSESEDSLPEVTVTGDQMKHSYLTLSVDHFSHFPNSNTQGISYLESNYQFLFEHCCKHLG